MFNDLSTPLSFLATRRSGKPRDMVEPGPSPAEMQRIFEIVLRTPDHGKLAPWRFVTVARGQRDAFSEMLQSAFRAERGMPDGEEIGAIRQFAHQAPALVVALHSPVESAKIPVWEQELSTGAACFNLLAAVHAHGYVGGWLTGWATYSEAVRDAFGAAPERIAGFIFIGTPGEDLKERPRPEFGEAVSEWTVE